MRTSRKIQGRIVREITDDNGNFPVGCILILFACVIVILTVFVQSEASYSAGLSRWPESLAVWMGLGNSRYHQSNLPGAAAAFQSATELTPPAGEAYNNLAHVLSEMGRQEEALTAARQAIAVGGPNIETFRTTLGEIQGH